MRGTVRYYYVQRLRYGTENVDVDNNNCLEGTFENMQGIGGIEREYFYVVDNTNNRVLKFDWNWNHRQTTSKTVGGTLFNSPYGILVTGSNIFVCDTGNNRICIFDHTLNFVGDISCNNLPTTDIAFFKDKYFVITKDSIVILDKDFKQEERICSMTSQNGDKKFDVEKGLRGICASSKYLFVTERYGRILCLEYAQNPIKLILVHQLPDCFPIVIAHHNERIFYSRSVNSEMNEYTIAEITISDNCLKSKDLF